MTSRPRIAIVSPGRTSSGGSAFARNLTQELTPLVDGEVVVASLPAAGRSRLPANVAAADTTVFLGARVVPKDQGISIFWPLNVAPLDRGVTRLPHTSARNRARQVLLRSRLHASVKAADGLCFGSHYARALYTTNFAEGSRLPYAVIPGGTPSVDVAPRVPTEGERLILCCSHLYPYKGIIEFVRALERVRLPADVRVRIAGADRDRRYAAAVRAAIDAAGLSGQVEVAPADATELAALYARAELAVFPSTCENAGSFGLFDGFHAALPTICSDRSSMPEMARGAADLVNPYDAEAFARAITRALDSSEWRTELRQRSERWSAEAPTWADRARQLLAFAESLR